MSFNILNIGDRVLVDNSVVSREMHSHLPYANATFNHCDEIRIPIQTQDIYTLPSESYLYIEGRLTNDGKESNTLRFINNGLMHLFDEIRYEIGGCVIDRVRNLGITTTMKNYASFTQTESNRYNCIGWSINDTPTVADKAGNFNVCIPLKLVLGFFEDFTKILINIRQELVLIRSSTDLNAVMSTVETELKPKVEIFKLIWKMPHIQVSDSEKLRLYKFIENGSSLELAYRSWEYHEIPLLPQTMKFNWNVKTTSLLERPRFVLFALQTAKKNAIKEENSYFDHCNLTNLKLFLNSEMYPYDNLNLNFSKRHYALAYEMYAQFQPSYYYKSIGDPCLTMLQFCAVAPIFVIDCSRQNESIKSGSVDMRIEIETNKNIPANTTAYCIIIHDRIVKYNPLTNVVQMF
ncbi:uncharacterized protein [Diabrotica undecimpunctata]|uniref:uncharacterized protein n=1 Tax=Diabrotica undecimpunctata TaxID=50387 RepID=UPI003B634FC1